MNKVFVKLYRIAVILFVFLAAINLFSCSGLLLNNSASGSVSFEIDSSILNASRNGDIIGNHERSYRVEVTLEDNKANKVQQIINVSSTDFNECLETDRKMVAEFEKIPVGRTCFAEIKIFPEIKVEESSDSKDFEQEPAIVGKSKKFKVKAGKNDISVNAYYYRYAFPFSITISFEELNQGELEIIKNNLIIDALTTDSENAARLAQAGNDKYKIYETCSQSLYGDGQLSIYSDDTTFKINDDNKSLTVTGKMYLPISELDYATQGKDIVLVAVMYAYDTNSGTLKTKLFGKSDTITPLKGQTNTVSFTAKKLNVLDTPVILYEDSIAARDFYIGSKDNPINVIGDYDTNFCFDNKGYIYTLIGSSEYQLAYDLQTNNPSLSGVSIRNHRTDWEVDNIIIDLKTNILYSYYINTDLNNPVIMLYAYPSLYPVTNQDEIIEGTEITIGPFAGSNSGGRITPEYLTIYNDSVYIITKNSSGEKYFFTMSLVQESGESQGKKLELPEGNITDMLYLDEAIYFVISDFYFPSELNTEEPVHSRGAVAKYDITTGQIKVLGDTKEATPTDTGKVYLCHYSSNYFIYDYEDHSLPITLSKDYVFPNGQTGPIQSFFPDLYAPVNSPNAFRNPTKIIAIKPKKLVIADDGLFFYTDNDAWNFKNSDRIIVVDLENFSIESINNTSVEFENQISQNLISGSTYGVIASSYFGTDSIYNTLLQVYDPLNDPAYADNGTVCSDVCGAFKNSDLDE